MRELSVVEQRYRAVLEVSAGVSVTDVAERYGVSRQSVYTWVERYRVEGLDGLRDRSRRPKENPNRLAGEVEAAICEMRRAHRRWGPRRIVFELDRRGYQAARSTAYRVLVRNGLIEPNRRRRRRSDYIRWERPAPMMLWQLDVTASVFLVDGGELKIVTGVDDHSRFCVLAKVVARATARAVCAAFCEAMDDYGVPEEVLTDNGKVFTGRFTRPVGVEVLFERICRENAITARLTKPRSPTTTGKIERLHQSLQDELLDDHGPFETIEAAQQALDAWRDDYNRDRPHQSLDMAAPATRFRAAADPQVAVVRPPQLRSALDPGEIAADEPDDELVVDHEPARDHEPAVDVLRGDPAGLGPGERLWQPDQPLEVKRVVPAAGNLWVTGQQVWLGPALAGRVVTIWVDQRRLHVSLDGTRLKTLPSRLSATDLARLAAGDGTPAGSAPLPELDETADGVDIDRTVNAAGLVSVAGRYHAVGSHLAGQRVTLRLQGQIMHVLAGAKLLRSLPCGLPVAELHRLRGARPVPRHPLIVTEQITVQRRVSTRGSIRVVNQAVQLGKAHAGKTVTVTVNAELFRIVVDDTLTVEVARTNQQPVRRYKAHATTAPVVRRRSDR